MATATNGNYAVGSDTGEIRFYDRIGNAKNLIPSLLGDKIANIDCSTDGKWILATTKSYLILLPALVGDKNAYKAVFPKDSKPCPKVLRVAPLQMQKNKIKELNLRDGKFDDKKDGNEQYIVATSDNFLVMWSMKNISNGKFVSTEV